MSRRLVKTIRATQVGVDGDPWSGARLSDAEKARLGSIHTRHRSTVELRQAGISPLQAERLEFLRWLVERGDVGQG
jgi:hypothetical protein